jgi:NAD(P)H-flavin reductase
MGNNKNPYIPYRVTIEQITIENEAQDLKTFDLKFVKLEDAEAFTYTCGQFAEISVLGIGESPIGIASSPMDKGVIAFTVKKYPTGVVTTALHNMEAGDEIGVRGPYGNSYPMKEMEGQNAVIIGGGFAFTTLRSTIKYILHPDNRKRYGRLDVIYGARGPGDLLYKKEMAEWAKRDDINLYVTVDKAEGDWKGREGFVPTVTKQVAPSSKDAFALVCGPPIMLKFTIPVLTELGFPPERIINSLEMRMKCGFGKCGRCNIGNKYVCKDGPVFTLKQLQEMPAEY